MNYIGECVRSTIPSQMTESLMQVTHEAPLVEKVCYRKRKGKSGKKRRRKQKLQTIQETVQTREQAIPIHSPCSTQSGGIGGFAGSTTPRPCPPQTTQTTSKGNVINQGFRGKKKGKSKLIGRRRKQTRRKPTPCGIQETPPTNIVEGAVDTASQLGKFGWHEIEYTALPYLTRSSDMKVVSKRMAYVKLIHDMEKLFSWDVLSCMPQNQLHATAAEAKVLNDINRNHSDNHFGSEYFKEGDPLIPLSDLAEMVMFLKYCSVAFCKRVNVDWKPCGFMKIDVETVPYVLSNDKKYLPVFYFNGDVKALEKRAIKIDGWKSSYIKLLCKVQGVRKEFFESPSVDCVEIDHLKQFLRLGTLLEETWPSISKLEYRKSSSKSPAASGKAPKTSSNVLRPN